MTQQEDLAQMKTGEIADRARKMGIKDVESMNKQEMIDAMASGKSSGGSKSGKGGGGKPAQSSNPAEWKNIPGNQS